MRRVGKWLIASINYLGRELFYLFLDDLSMIRFFIRRTNDLCHLVIYLDDHRWSGRQASLSVIDFCGGRR